MGRVSSAFSQRLWVPPLQGIVLWLSIGVVSLFLGVFTVTSLYNQSQLTPLLIGALLFLITALVIGDLRKLLLTAILIDIPFPIDMYPGYREDIALLGSISGFCISISTICLLGLYILWAGEYLSKQEFRPRLRIKESLPLICYFALAGLSASFASDFLLCLFQFSISLHFFLVYIYIASTVRTQQEIVFLVKMFLVGLILQSLVIMFVRLTGQDFSFAGLSTGAVQGYEGNAWTSSRVGGTLGSPNNAAAYLAMMMTLSLSILLTRLNYSYKWLAMLGFGLGAVALVFTGSRGGWTAFIVSTVVLGISACRRGWLSPAVVLTAGAFVVMAALLTEPFQGEISARLREDDQGAAYARVPLMKLAFRMIEDSPILGVGANNFGIRMKDYMSADLAGEWIYTVHNKYLLVWSEIGTGGLLAFLWFLFTALRRGFRCCRSPGRMLAPLALGLTAAICGHMIHMLSEVFNGRPLAELLGITSGLITAICLLQKQATRTV